MFNARIKSFMDFVSESLTISYWRNYKDDTPVDVDKEVNDISIEIIKLFNVKSQDELMFTSSNIGFGADYLFFYDIIKSLTAEEQKTLNMPGYIVYINFYTDPKTDKPIALVNSKSSDGGMSSYIFIKTEDFKSFDPDANDTIEEDDEGEEGEEGDGGAQGGEGGGQQEGGAPPQGGDMGV